MDVPMMVCERCRRREVVGVLSSRAWLVHVDGEGASRRLCVTCQGELTEEQLQHFVTEGRLDIG
jgi:hypothetical protein